MAAHHYGSSGLPGEQPPAAAGTHKKKARVALLAMAAALLFVARCVLSGPLPQTTSTAKFHLLHTNTMQLGAQQQHANRRHPEAAQVEAEATARTSWGLLPMLSTDNKQTAGNATAAAEAMMAEARALSAQANASQAEANAMQAEANATMAKANATMAQANATMAQANATMASANATMAKANATMASANATMASANATLASANASLAVANQTLPPPPNATTTVPPPVVTVNTTMSPPLDDFGGMGPPMANATVPPPAAANDSEWAITHPCFHECNEVPADLDEVRAFLRLSVLQQCEAHCRRARPHDRTNLKRFVGHVCTGVRWR